MNKLERLEEFKRVLADYRISEGSKRILEKTRLAVWVAPTASGRNTIIRELMKTGDYHFIISDTTRKPRVNNGVPEQSGIEYWFRSEEETLRDLKAGKFLEAEIIHGQQVSGISIRELKKASDRQKIALADMDIGGVLNVINAKPDTIVLVILPPSFEEWQRRRASRGVMDSAEYRRRLETACRIFEVALTHPDFIFIINDKLDEAVKQIHDLVVLGQHDAALQTTGRHLAKQLFEQTQVYLRENW